MPIRSLRASAAPPEPRGADELTQPGVDATEYPDVIGGAQHVPELIDDPGSLFKHLGRLLGIPPFELDTAQVEQSHAGFPQVAQLPAHGDGLFEPGDRQVEVSLPDRSGGQDDPQVGSGGAFESFFYQGLALPEESRYAVAVIAVQHGPSEAGKRERGARPIAELLVEGDRLFEGGYGRSVVLLEEEDEAEPPECLGLGPDSG